MFRTLNLTAAAAVAALVPAVATADEAPRRFVHDGDAYSYTRTVSSDGETTIVGRRDGVPFRLVVRRGRVTGMSGTTPVSFTVAQAQGAAAGSIVTTN